MLMSTALLTAAVHAQRPEPGPEPAKAANPGTGKGAAKKVKLDPRLGQLYEPREFQEMPYRLMTPVDYDPAKVYPLIVSLHGAGGLGSDNVKNLRVGWTSILARDELRREHPCFVVAPQTAKRWSTPDDKIPELDDAALENYPESWRRFYRRRMTAKAEPGKPERPVGGDLVKVFDLIAALEAEFPIDRDRVYVLGHSMGGMGTWNAVHERPDLFAAAIPTAGGLPPWKDPKRFARVPIWAFHGEADPTVPVDFTRILFEAMKQCGGNMKYSELKGVNHNLNLIAFDHKGDDEAKGWITQSSSALCDREDNVWDWLFKQKRRSGN
jgi:predicted peptidase